MTGNIDLPTRRSPSLAPGGFVEMLQEADTLLALMGSEPLCVVADLANELTARANDAGAPEIANAASKVSRLASGHREVVLAGAIRDLTSAITQAQRDYHLDAA
jgi:hypothetical protein